MQLAQLIAAQNGVELPKVTPTQDSPPNKPINKKISTSSLQAKTTANKKATDKEVANEDNVSSSDGDLFGSANF